ncbi:MAG: hypothetical protein IPG46_02610 [Actinobacteria bacterium]|nr:hypothetical protein [Actinomycetota bacterium]
MDGRLQSVLHRRAGARLVDAHHIAPHEAIEIGRLDSRLVARRAHRGESVAVGSLERGVNALGSLAPTDRGVGVETELVEERGGGFGQLGHVPNLVGEVLRRHLIPEPALHAGLTDLGRSLAPGQRVVHVPSLSGELGVAFGDPLERGGHIALGELPCLASIADVRWHRPILAELGRRSSADQAAASGADRPAHPAPDQPAVSSSSDR